MTTRSTLALLALAAACGGGGLRTFPMRQAMLVDNDSTPFLPKPKEYKAPEIWDTAENILFKPIVDVLAVHQTRRAVNVNALDEVPDSSWFTNRIDQVTGDLAAFTQGACEGDAPDAAGPWKVIAGKPNGANPGFMVEHANGTKFFFKPDTGRGRERQGIADLFGTRVYHAAGYNTACARIIYVQPSAFVLSPKAKAENAVGDKVPFTQAMLDKALSASVRGADNSVRGGLSQLLPGKPIGPWRDFGVRPDDPNDVIPHENRRELRGSYIFGAWLSHYDAREQNSLDMWTAPAPDAPGFVKHFMLDFGDCFGSLSGWERVSRRRGHVHEVDWPIFFAELVTFGLLERPWRDPQMTAAGPRLGYYSADEPFDPDRYSTAYPYGPYTQVTEADAAWGARILARITPEMVHGLIVYAGLTDKVMERELERAILVRREKLLRRFLSKLSPLARPQIVDGNLCVTDARIEGGLTVPGVVTARIHDGAALPIAPGRAPAETCVAVPSAGDYQVIELRADATRPLLVHLYRTGAGYAVAGVDRD